MPGAIQKILSPGASPLNPSATSCPPPPRALTDVCRMYDVSWCTKGTKVAASLNNGGVCVWDLAHLTPDPDVRGLKGAGGGGDGDAGGVGNILGMHTRSVNRIGWDPHNPRMLMSGSQVRVCVFSFSRERLPPRMDLFSFTFFLKPQHLRFSAHLRAAFHVSSPLL